MGINLDKKKKIFDDLHFSLKDVEVISLVSFSGISSVYFKIFRQKLLLKNIGIKVLKKTSIKRLFKLLKLDFPLFEGQAFILFSNDLFSLIKFLDEIKSFDYFSLKATIISNKFISENDFMELALYTSKIDIVFKFSFSLKIILFRFLNALNIPLILVKNLKFLEFIKRET